MDKYPKEKELGVGSYGSVYASTREGRKYAVKVQKDRIDTGTTTASLREAAYLIALDGHRNVVEMVDVGLTTDGVFMSMPLADATLKELLPLVDLDAVADCFYQLALGLAHVHDNNIIHRDLKPQNILANLEPNGRFSYKIADFGLSRGNACNDDKNFNNNVVTLWYRAPEIVLEGKYSFKSDVWSLGCVYYEILTGQPLFPSQDEHGLMAEFVKKLGPIDLTEWPDAVNYPEYDTIRKLVFSTKKDWKSTVRPATLRVLEGMLTYNPATRASLGKVLADPLFDGPKKRDGIDPKDDVIGVRPCEDMVVERLLPLGSEQYSRVLGLLGHDLLVQALKWILLVSDRISASSFTVALTFAYFYWYFSETGCKKQQNAVATIAACVSLATKVNEDYPIDVDDIVYGTGIKTQDVVKIEKDVVRCIGFDLYRTTVVSLVAVFGRFYSSGVRVQAMQYALFSYMTAVPFEQPARDVAIAAIHLACDAKHEEFKHHSTYTHSPTYGHDASRNAREILRGALKELRDRHPNSSIGKSLKDL